MPGILGAVAGAISASLASEEEYGSHIKDIFAARGDGRSASAQGTFKELFKKVKS